MNYRPRLDPSADHAFSAFRHTVLREELWHELAGRHLLLTGATGFFGRWLLALLYRLNGEGAGVTVSAVSRSPACFLRDHPEYQQLSWLHWHALDVRQLGELPERPIDLILHAATDTSAAAHERGLELFDSIIDGARAVLKLAVRGGARRVLFTGSGAQYGSLHLGHPVSEVAQLACDSRSAQSAYAEAKRAQETLAALYARQVGIEPVFTRCFAFAGPGLSLDAHFAIGNFVRDALFSDAIKLSSNGDAVRSYLHGADLAVWLLFLLVRGGPGEVYNVGSGEAISIRELALRIGQRLAPGKSVQIPPPTGQAGTYYVPDISKARGLGLEVWTSLDEVIDSMGCWASETYFR